MRAQSHAKTRKGLAIVTAGMFALSSMTIAPVAFAEDTPPLPLTPRLVTSTQTWSAS